MKSFIGKCSALGTLLLISSLLVPSQSKADLGDEYSSQIDIKKYRERRCRELLSRKDIPVVKKDATRFLLFGDRPDYLVVNIPLGSHWDIKKQLWYECGFMPIFPFLLTGAVEPINNTRADLGRNQYAKAAIVNKVYNFVNNDRCLERKLRGNASFGLYQQCVKRGNKYARGQLKLSPDGNSLEAFYQDGCDQSFSRCSGTITKVFSYLITYP